MRTELAVVLALAWSAAPAAAQDGDLLSAERFTVSLPIEVHVIGAAAGVRPDVLWRPFAADGAFHVRAAAGFLPGPEFLFLPIELGARWAWHPAWFARPFVGVSVEGQGFFISDGPPTTRLAFATELGWGIDINELTWSLAVAPSLAPFGVPGPGLAVRTVFSIDVDRLLR